MRILIMGEIIKKDTLLVRNPGRHTHCDATVQNRSHSLLRETPIDWSIWVCWTFKLHKALAASFEVRKWVSKTSRLAWVSTCDIRQCRISAVSSWFCFGRVQ